jgi:hypothetical protein
MSATPNLPLKFDLPQITNPESASAGADGMLSLGKAAKHLKLSARSLVRAEKRGWIAFTRTPAGHRRIRPQDLEAAPVLRVGHAASLFGVDYWSFRRALLRANGGKSPTAAPGVAAQAYLSHVQAKALADAIRLQRSGKAILGVLDQSRALAALVPTTDPLLAAMKMAKQTETILARPGRIRFNLTRLKQETAKHIRKSATWVLAMKVRREVSEADLLPVLLKIVGDEDDAKKLATAIVKRAIPR